MYIGAATTFYRNAHVATYFGARIIYLRNNNLEGVFIAEWRPGSIYEHLEMPLHHYSVV
jgi:hypothetical protein